MHFPMWNFRLSNRPINETLVYEGQPTLFTIKLYHGGEFTKFPDVSYVDGSIVYVDLVDIDEFSIHEMDAIMKGLGYSVPPVIYYHFLVPNGDFHFGLRPLGNDDDLRNLAQYVKDHKRIRVYTEHGQTNLLTYFMNPKPMSNVIIQEMDEQEKCTDGTRTSPVFHDVRATPQIQSRVVCNKTRLALTVSPEFNRKKDWDKIKGMSTCTRKLSMDDAVAEQIANDFDNAANDFDIGFYQQILETDYLNQVEVNEVNEDHQGNEVDEVEEVTEINEDNQVHEVEEVNEDPQDKESQEHGDFYTGDVGLDGIKEKKNGSQDHSDLDNDDDSGDSDYWVDEENLIPNVEVDMRDFHMNVDSDAEFFEDNRTEVVDNDKEPQELDVIQNDEWDSLDEDSDLDKKRRAVLKQLGKERQCSLGEVHTVKFHIGQKFKTKPELKDKIDLHALETRRNIFFVKNDLTRLTAKCKGKVAINDTQVGGPTLGEKSKSKSKGKDKKANVECPWLIHASRSTVEDNWVVKTYQTEHTCLQSRKVRSATAKFISKQIMDQIESNPTVPVRALQDQLQKKYNVGFSMHKVFRAKQNAKKQVVGDYTKQYELLRDYILELQSTNPDTTVKLDFVSEPNLANTTSRTFRRIYVCLGGMKQGFKACLRDFLGLDGAFMKGPFPGQILTAVGVDSNNGIYPLAYAIVETENTRSWKWFLECLGDDLDLVANSNFTFISDRQKGLIPALAETFPCAEHRYCLRHIYENMRKTWRTKEYKEHLWKCATATTIPEFNHFMKELSIFDKGAYDWVKQIPAKHWARSHFTGRPLTDMLLNNVCEVFNRQLVEGRDKPIISCLEYIREYMMKRICNVMKVQDKCVGPLTPSASKIFEQNTTAAAQYTATWNGSDKYQVQGPWQDQHVVDMGKKVCSCRKWELTGIPCKHVIAVLFEKGDHGEVVGELHTYVHSVHWLETWKAAYAYKVEPIKGRTLWPVSDCPMKINPPPHHNQPGRPKRKRKQSVEERLQSQSQSVGTSGSQSRGGEQVHVHGPGGSGKLTRKFMKVTCSKCKVKGHNARSCKSQGGN